MKKVKAGVFCISHHYLSDFREDLNDELNTALQEIEKENGKNIDLKTQFSMDGERILYTIEYEV